MQIMNKEDLHADERMEKCAIADSEAIIKIKAAFLCGFKLQ